MRKKEKAQAEDLPNELKLRFVEEEITHGNTLEQEGENDNESDELTVLPTLLSYETPWSVTSDEMVG